MSSAAESLSQRTARSVPAIAEAELVRRHSDLVKRIAHHLAARLPSME